MSDFQKKDLDVNRAQQIWTEYQLRQDVSSQQGRTAGIDPVSGRVWFGDSILAVSQQLQAEGIDAPLYFVRVGQDYYYRKGGRR